MNKKAARGNFDTGAIATEKQEMKFFCENEYCRKTCSNFVPDISNRRRGRCSGCLYLKSEHISVPHLRRWTVDSKSWRPDIHMEYIAWQSFLKVTLNDEVNSVEKEADIAILANDTHPRQLLNVITQRWVLEKPSFVIAVSGSQRHLSLTAKQSTRFKREFVNAVASSKCWVIGGGTLSGVDYLVGQALRELQFKRWIVDDENEFFLLGLVNWDCVDIKTRLDKKLKRSDHSKLNFMIKHGAVDASCTEDQFMTTLNPLYSHFLCVEGGIKGKPFQEAECRSELLSFIAKPFDEFTVPTVLVVVGGELETLKEVSAVLTDDVPVVICEGTGGACDVICYALKIAERAEYNQFTDEQELYLMKQMEAILVRPKRKGTLYSEEASFEAAIELKHLHNCIDRRRNIFIYRINLSLSMPLNQCILKALLNGKTAQTKDPVELALDWDRCDDVIKDILQAEGGDMGEKRNLNKLMTKAVLDDKMEFIELFIEFGFEWQRFLTPAKLGFLYANAISKQESSLRLLLQQRSSKDSFRLKDVYQIVYLFTSAKPELYVKQLSDENRVLTVFQDPFRELFIWAILTERMEASQFFWRHCQNGVHLALIGAALWKAIALVTHSVDETRIEELHENAKAYLEYALDVLECAWSVNQSLAHVALELKPWQLGRKSLLDVAGFIEAKQFIAHPLSQIVLEHQWKGRLNCTLSHVFMGLLFPPYLSFISVTKKLIPSAPAELWLEDKPFKKKERDPDDEDDDDDDDDNHESTDLKNGLDEGFNKEKNAAFVPKQNGDKVTELKKKFEGSSRGELVELTETPVIEPVEPEWDIPDEGDELLDKLALFYGVPVTKFVVHLISYMAFLIIYSMFYVFYYTEDGTRGFYEIIVLWVWVASYLDLIQSLVAQDASWFMKIKLWIKSEWNILDFCYLNIALCSFAMHGYYPKIVKGWYGIVCLLMWIRLLRFYTCSQVTGPMWIMIRKMLVELVIFLSILGILILASGIFLKGMMNSFNYEDAYSGPVNSMEMWSWLFLRPFFMFNGELFMDAVQGSVQDLNMPTEDRDSFLLLYFFTILFIMFFGNALLLNLVIAIFGTIYSEVEGISDMEWKNEMFLLVKEYENKPHFPPPFSIIESVISLIKYFLSRSSKLTPEELEAEKKSSERFSVFEDYCIDVTLKERETRQSALQQVEKTIMCVDTQHSRLFDMDLTIHEMARLAQKSKKKHNADYSSTTLPRNK